VGWDAKRPEIEAAVAEDVDRDALVVRAVAAQENDKRRGRRLSPEEIERAMAARQQLRPEMVALLKTYVRERRQADPSIKGSELRREVNRTYEVEISEANFYATYWAGPKPSTNGAAPAQAKAAPSTNGKHAPAKAPAAAGKPRRMAAPPPPAAAAALESPAFDFDRAIGWALEYREAHPKMGPYNGWTEYRKLFGDGMDETTFRRQVWRYSDPKKVAALAEEMPAPGTATCETAAGDLKARWAEANRIPEDAADLLTADPLPMEAVLAARESETAYEQNDQDARAELAAEGSAPTPADFPPPAACPSYDACPICGADMELEELHASECPAVPEGNVDTVPPLEAVTIQPPESIGTSLVGKRLLDPRHLSDEQVDRLASPPPAAAATVGTRIDFTTPKGSLRGEQGEDGRWSLALELFGAPDYLVGEIVLSMLSRRVAA
jgi:hypothetical protein